jgi:hypothetical protein
MDFRESRSKTFSGQKCFSVRGGRGIFRPETLQNLRPDPARDALNPTDRPVQHVVDLDEQREGPRRFLNSFR